MDDQYKAQAERTEAQKEAAKQQKLRDIADLKKLVKLPEFRRFCWRKWAEARVFHNPYVPNSDLTVFNSGFKQAGLDLLAEVNEADPTIFPQIQREAVSERNSKKEKTS